MELLQMSKKSVHSVIRTASMAITDPAFKLMEFESHYPAQVISRFLIGLYTSIDKIVIHENIVTITSKWIGQQAF